VNKRTKAKKNAAKVKRRNARHAKFGIGKKDAYAPRHQTRERYGEE